jgi:hypothetical protein
MTKDKWRVLRRHLVAPASCLFIVFPASYYALDRQPPQVRLRGSIHATADPGRAPRLGEEFSVVWQITPHLRDCPGSVQVEIIDSGHDVHVKTTREAFNDAVGSMTIEPPPWVIPDDAKAGPAVYRVTTFWYCTWFQRLLDWPVVQVGPDIPFMILPRRSQ